MSKQMRKVRVGSVVGTRMDRTAVVEMVWKQRHRLYRKQMRRVARFYIHDPENQCQVGDTVRIQETRPISKTKHWRLLEILQHRQVAEVRPIELEIDIETAIAAPDETAEATVDELATGPADSPEEEPETAPATPSAEADEAGEGAVDVLETGSVDSTDEEPETVPETPSVEADESGEAAVDELERGAADSTEEESKE